MNTETALLLGWLAGTVSTFVGLASYAKIVAPAKGGGWRPLKLGRLESTAEQVAVIARDVPPARPAGGEKVVYPSAMIYGSTTPDVRTQEAYRFNLASPDGTTKTILMPARYIARFVQMDEVKRDNWTGKAEYYSDMIRIAQSRQWIEPHELRQNAWQWVHDMRTLGRRVNRLSIEQISLPPILA